MKTHTAKYEFATNQTDPLTFTFSAHRITKFFRVWVASITINSKS